MLGLPAAHQGGTKCCLGLVALQAIELGDLHLFAYDRPSDETLTQPAVPLIDSFPL